MNTFHFQHHSFPLAALLISAAAFNTTTALAQATRVGDAPSTMTREEIAQRVLAAIDSLENDSVQKKQRNGIGRKLLNYFKNSNKQKPDKKIDFGFIPGPNYSSTTGFGLGLLGTATYSADCSDKTLPRSNVSAYSNMTTGGFFMVGLRGNHIFPHERYRLDYKMNLSTFSTQFWGIGYANADNDDNETDYRRNRINAMARFMFKMAPKTYIGPFINYNFYEARNVKDEALHLWEGQDRVLHTYTAGVSFTYDSRDFMLNASQGVFLQIDQTFTPRCFGNGDNNFSSTEVTFATYGKLWKGAILAGELHGMFNYGHTPWAMLAEVGTNDRMRGYYAGRYRDKDLIEGQVELRQHIKGRNGVVAWVALANAFPDFNNIAWRRTLPNAGVGYRWEFKKRINIRIDYGFTKKGGGFILNINEAF